MKKIEEEKITEQVKKEQAKEYVDDFNSGRDYVVEMKRKYIYVCLNNGQFHTGNCCNMGGYAKFVGKFSVDEFLEWVEY